MKRVIRWALVLLPVCLLATSCRDRKGAGAIERRQREIDLSTGSVQGTILWNGSPIDAIESNPLHLVESGSIFEDTGTNSYQLPTVTPGVHTLGLYVDYCTDSPGGKIGSTTFTVVAGVTTTADFDLTGTAGRVLGSVLVNGAPLPNARLAIRLRDGDSCGHELSANDSGVFSRMLTPGTYVASVLGVGGTSGSVTFTIALGQTTDIGALDIPLGSVQGTILWNGSPISAADQDRLFLFETDSVYQWMIKNGYQLPAVTPGAHTVGLYVNDCPALSNTKIGETSFTVVAGSTTTADFDLTGSAGRVVGSIHLNGAPLTNGGVEIHPRDGQFCRNSAETNNSGVFSRMLSPGTYVADIYGGAGIASSVTFAVTVGQTTDIGDVNIQVGSVRGTILWNGSPISVNDAQSLYLFEPGSVSYGVTQGTYQLQTVTPGAHTLGLYVNSCTSQTESKIGETNVTVVAGVTTTADFDLTGTAGHVTGSIHTNGAPLAFAILGIRLRDRQSCTSTVHADSNGAFSLILTPGTYVADVHGSSRIIGSFTFTVFVGQTTDVDSLSTPAGTDVFVDLSGGIDKVGGMSLDFAEVTTAGDTTVVKSGGCSPSCSPPPTGFEIVGARYWDIQTTAIYSGPIQICIHYDQAEVRGDESALRFVHDDGSGFVNITTSIDTVRNVVCGFASSLSPFAVVQPKVGAACTSAAECVSGHCVDGVCCGSACGGGDPSDCQVCSIAAGGTTDGVCRPVSAPRVCRPSAGICDAAETCDGLSLQCPPNTFASAGSICRASVGACDIGEACTGTSAACPTDSLAPAAQVCRASAGTCDIAETCTGSTAACPADSFVAGGTICRPASNACQSPGTCSGTGSSCPGVTPIPGCSTDTTPPVFSNVPGPVTAFATSTTGVKVSYTLPKAVDAVDSARLVTCSPTSGTTFSPGKTTVSCTAADKVGNKSTASFTVWVQYQAPNDGTFFLKPIRPNGTSIFRIGRPVPVRFKLTGASAGITNLVAKLVVTKISNSVQGTTEDASDETVADTDFVFQYRAALKWYAYRWKTTDQTQGTYQLKAELGDGVVHQINVSLRAAK